MSNTINLVQSDTGPDLTVTLYDAGSNAPIDVSGGSDVVRLHVRLEGQSGVPVVTMSFHFGEAGWAVTFSSQGSGRSATLP